jgi:hypothetical protein
MLSTSNEMLVQFRVKSNYGNELNYPANETAKLFCQLVGRTTLMARDLDTIKLLGYKTERVM